MFVLGCGVRSTVSSRSPGPVKLVASWLRLSFQPGGSATENPAVLFRSLAARLTWCHPDGTVVVGLFSALTDLALVVVSGTMSVTAAALLDPLLPGLFSARAAPTPAPIATTTAAASQMTRLLPRVRRVRPPPPPGW